VSFNAWEKPVDTLPGYIHALEVCRIHCSRGLHESLKSQLFLETCGTVEVDRIGCVLKLQAFNETMLKSFSRNNDARVW
jgi:hypothetical protein